MTKRRGLAMMAAVILTIGVLLPAVLHAGDCRVSESFLRSPSTEQHKGFIVPTVDLGMGAPSTETLRVAMTGADIVSWREATGDCSKSFGDGEPSPCSGKTACEGRVDVVCEIVGSKRDKRKPVLVTVGESCQGPCDDGTTVTTFCYTSGNRTIDGPDVFGQCERPDGSVDVRCVTDGPGPFGKPSLPSIIFDDDAPINH